MKLDRTGQRIVGVLVEKELSVPEVYPMSENALVDGCNQKSNRDPVLELASFQVAGALMALQQDGWIARVEGGGRVVRYKHRVVERLQVDRAELAVFAELLLRGPQAPGALKPRLPRMGVHLEPPAIEALLLRLAQRGKPLVELLPLGPRERDRRWRHLLGDGSELAAAPAAGGAAEDAPAARPAASPAPAAGADDLATRVARLEAEVAALRDEVAALRRGGT